MATASFDKEFVVTDKESINRIRQDLAQPRRIVVRQRNYKADSEKGIKLLLKRKQQLSRLENC